MSIHGDTGVQNRAVGVFEDRRSRGGLKRAMGIPRTLGPSRLRSLRGQRHLGEHLLGGHDVPVQTHGFRVDAEGKPQHLRQVQYR